MGCGASNAAAPAAAPDTPQVEKRVEPAAPAPAPAASAPAPAPAPAASAPAPAPTPAPAEDAAAAAGPALPGGVDLKDDPVQSSAAAQVYAMLKKQEGKDPVDKNEAARYLKALVMCYKPTPPPPPQEVQALTAGDGTMNEGEFIAAIDSLPALKAKIDADWDSTTGRFKKFRTCEDQLSKLYGNLDRLRQRQARGEKVDAEIESRKKQVKKFRAQGIVPNPAICVFNQIDIDKSRSISADELKRAMKGLKHVYNASAAEIDEMLKVLDTDGSGELDETEWVENLDKLPALKAALASDIDPDTGKLKSFRSPRQQYAKLLGNIDRLEYDISRGDGDVEAKKVELASRRAKADRFRLSGVQPSPGIVVFNQIDKKKTGKITKEQLQKLFTKMSYDAKSVDEVMAKLDTDNDGAISEKEWLAGLDYVQTLKMALQKDVDPETGKIKSLITSGKAIFDMLRRQEGVYAVDSNEVGRYLKALNAVYKPDNGSMSMEVDDKADELIEKGKEKMTPDQWLELLGTMPDLDQALKDDYDKERVRFRHFRSCGQQLSKLLGNLDRLRYRERLGEDVSAQIESRKKQVKKLRGNGILPSAGLCVFNQVDVDKSGSMDARELRELVRQLRELYSIPESEAHMMETLDANQDGEISVVEWCHYLSDLPGLKTALQADLDPNTGRLRSYKTPRQQFAKLLANIDRLEYDYSKGDDVLAELTSRREQAQRFRLAGVTPSAGIVVFAQIDKKKTGYITKAQLTKLFSKMEGFIRDDLGKAVESVMAKLDTDMDGAISEQEWLAGLDAVPTLKAALEKDIDPETGKLKCLITSGKAIFDMLRRQEGQWAVDKNEVARYLNALNAVYKPGDPNLKKLHDEYVAAGKEKLTPDQWLEALATLPALDKALQDDYDRDRVRFRHFRSCGQQLSKLLGNLDRLRYRERLGENVTAEIESRKKQVKKMQLNGITPSAGLSVFNQIDVDKSGTITVEEFRRLLQGIKKLYKVSPDQEAELIKALDSDGSGEIDVVEWCNNLYLAPGLKAALQKDLDPKTGRLKSFRTPRQNFAKLLGNIDRLEYDISRGDGDVEAKMKELDSRRHEAQRFRLAGVTPSAGIVVFNQMDKKKTRRITKEQLTKLFSRMEGFVREDLGKAVDSVMAKLDTDKDGFISEKEWLVGLDTVPSLKAALEKDLDPETGKLKSLQTSGKAIFDMIRRQEGVYAVDKKEVGRYLKALNAVYKPTDSTAEIAEKLIAEEGKMTPDEWLSDVLPSMPDLDQKLKDDYDKDRVRFKSFRSCGQQLSKLLGNLDRCRLKLKTASDEEKPAIEAEIASRKAQVKKMQRNGILPSPAVCVFNQIDLDKNGTVSIEELKRMLYGLRKVYPVGEEEVNSMLEKLDTDKSGEIDQVEWTRNLNELPALKKALIQDLDPMTGRLRSYRSPEDQLAKLLGNIMRLEYDIERGDGDVEAKKAELESRKAQAAKMREKGFVPSAGVVVFNQIDKKKTREIDKAGLQELITSLKVESKSVEELMQRLDSDSNGTISEKEWLQNLERCQDLKAALEADIDPDTGKLKSMEG